MADPIRIGILGCGQIAQSHLANYAKIPGVQVVAVCDVNPVALAATADKFAVPNRYERPEKLLERDDLEAVDVCLHNNFHLPATAAVLKAGKHCYCEKPMAGSYRDAQAMFDLAQQTGRKLHIQLSTLYTAETRAAKELIAAGSLGKVYHARSTGHRRRGRSFVDGYGSTTFAQKRFSGGGAVYDMGVYHIAQLLYLMGNPPVERVTGRTYQEMEMDQARREKAAFDVEELGVGFVHLANRMTLDIIEAWAIQLDHLDGSTLVGARGGVRLQPFGFFSTQGHLDLTSTIDLNQAVNRWQNVAGDWDHYASSQQHWIAALRGQVELLPTAAIALNTMLIQEGIYLSESLGREVTGKEIAQMSKSTAAPI